MCNTRNHGLTLFESIEFDTGACMNNDGVFFACRLQQQKSLSEKYEFIRHKERENLKDRSTLINQRNDERAST